MLALYRANHWSSADKPRELQRALANSHTVITAWDGARLVGLGNGLSDGALVVYYPHLLVLPEYQGQGIGREIVRRRSARYAGFHQHILVADGGAILQEVRFRARRPHRTDVDLRRRRALKHHDFTLGTPSSEPPEE